MADWRALIRPVPRSIHRCELTHIERVPIDLERARAQHRGYCTALVELGCRIEELPELPDHPDSVFVEDTALVLDEVAVLCRPGAESRRGEVQSAADLLARYRFCVRLLPPATLDGGDVMVVGTLVFVGLSSRTGFEAIGQLQTHLDPFGYRVIPVEMTGCLHLKTAVTALSDEAVLANTRWIDIEALSPLEVVEIDPEEPFAANVVRVGERLLYSDQYPRTLERLASLGLDPDCVDASELAKAEGALTCCSLIFREGD